LSSWTVRTIASCVTSGDVLKRSDSKALEPKTEAVALLVQDLRAVARLFEENKKHWIKDRDLDIQLDQRSQAVNGFSEVDGLGIEKKFFDFASGRIMVNGLLRASGAQHRASDKRFEYGVYGALTIIASPVVVKRPNTAICSLSK